MSPETRDQAIDSFMALLAERPWGEVTLEALAERSGLSLQVLRGGFDDRLDVLRAFTRRIDETVLGGIDPHMAGESKRERLFDLLFSRIEALRPYKAALQNLARGVRRDPLLALALNRMATVSMGWMLGAAGIRATGSMDGLHAQGLALVWSSVLRVWLDDDDPALSRTMAVLDRQLRRSERAVSRLERLCRLLPGGSRRPRQATPPPPPPAPTDIVEAHPS